MKKAIFLGLVFLMAILLFPNPTQANIESKSSATATATATATTIATKDTYVDSGDPTSNFGGQDNLWVGWWYGDAMEAYFYFPFTNKPSSYFKAVIQISIWGVSKTTPCNACIIEDTTWGEYTMNWLNKPSHGVNIEAQNEGLVTQDAYYLIDVTNYVVSRNNISICIYCRDPLLDDWIYIDSREEPSYAKEDRPRLIWYYTVSDDDDDNGGGDGDKDEDSLEAILKEIPSYNIFIIIGSVCGLSIILARRIKTIKK